MTKLILWRLLAGAGVLWVVSILIFAGTQLLPGDVADAILGRNATPETVAALREQLGLNQPVLTRYFNWMWGFVRGDFGTSVATGRDIGEMIGGRAYNTALLAGATALYSVPCAILLGIIAAILNEKHPLADRGISAVALLFISMPEFLLAYLLIFWLAIGLGWFPVISAPGETWVETARGLVMPSLALAGMVVPYVMRMTRAAVLNELPNAYFEMALLKGVTRNRAVFKYAFPVALAPILNVVAINLAYLVVGVVVIEVIFNYPGLGQLMVDAVAFRDIPTVQTTGMIFCTVFVLLNLLADVLAIISNPRLRHPR
ncbi:ABC transporter permease [Roseovarius sp. 2305UL8-3]|uniref:ABC transporter permease n=1 Tax=Roseovarius conchicola TaxID=3121636 RepID=UPI0035291770